MQSYFLRYILPIPQPPEAEILETQRVSYEFYQEVRHRQELENYYQWYQQLSAQNQQDLATMRQELNIMGWFCRWRR